MTAPGSRRSPLAVALAAAAVFAIVFSICAGLVFRDESLSQRLFGSLLLTGAVTLIATEPLLRVGERLAARRRR